MIARDVSGRPNRVKVLQIRMGITFKTLSALASVEAMPPRLTDKATAIAGRFRGLNHRNILKLPNLCSKFVPFHVYLDVECNLDDTASVN